MSRNATIPCSLVYRVVCLQNPSIFPVFPLPMRTTVIYIPFPSQNYNVQVCFLWGYYTHQVTTWKLLLRKPVPGGLVECEPLYLAHRSFYYHSLTLHPHMRRISQISLVCVRRYFRCIRADETCVVVLLPEFNSFASWPGFTAFLTFKVIYWIVYVSGNFTPSLNRAPAKWVLFPS